MDTESAATWAEIIRDMKKDDDGMLSKAEYVAHWVNRTTHAKKDDGYHDWYHEFLLGKLAKLCEQ